MISKETESPTDGITFTEYKQKSITIDDAPKTPNQEAVTRFNFKKVQSDIKVLPETENQGPDIHAPEKNQNSILINTQEQKIPKIETPDISSKLISMENSHASEEFRNIEKVSLNSIRDVDQTLLEIDMLLNEPVSSVVYFEESSNETNYLIDMEESNNETDFDETT